MAIVTYTVPTSASRTVADYRQSTIIDGREYLLRFYWNQRIGAWHLDVSDQDGDPIVHGLRLVLGADLFRNVVDSRLPPGHLFLLDRSGTGLMPDINELGERVLLIYITDDDG